MFELAHLDKGSFHQQFLKFRIKYYFNETKEFLARHKLLSVFIICLLAPGVEHIQAIGFPFYALIDPTNTLKEKLIYLILLLTFLLAMTKTQLSFIRGGELREYLHTLHISSHTYKKIDFIILLLSLNIVWMAVFFGAASILHYAKEPLFVLSQYSLYTSMILTIVTLLLNYLYRKIANGILLFSALILIVWSSVQASWLVNYGVSSLVIVLSVLTIWTVQPFVRARNHLFKMPRFQVGENNKCKKIFIIQLAALRANKRVLITRLLFCFAITGVILQVPNREGMLLILVGLQTYILSTLFALFEKGKQDYAVFHKVFPYQQQINFVKEVCIALLLLFIILVPVFFYYLFIFEKYFLWFSLMGAMSSVGLIINRIFYARSLRFCLFSTMLTTMGSCVVQYHILGACFGA
ncbi:hypothetical protein [Legionella saoudiensis]|uniref:hypothetical protein n=1 Tax=Legionella saoudiensis TaxID=1750561 RepID=UPI000730444B|nr:hypothetical protein [Legionella saoudiensis]